MRAKRSASEVQAASSGRVPPLPTRRRIASGRRRETHDRSRRGEPAAVVGIDQCPAARRDHGIGQRARLGHGVTLERAERRLALVGEDGRHAPSRLRLDEAIGVDERALQRACESSSHFRLSRAHEPREDEVCHAVTRASAPATIRPQALRRRQRCGARLDHLGREEDEQLLVVLRLERALEEPADRRDLAQVR